MKISGLTLIIILVVFKASFAENPNTNSRSDTINILNYSIHLSITGANITGNTIGGYCSIKFTPKINSVSIIDLDLLVMTIDSIKMNTQLLTYSYNDSLIKADLTTAMNIGDTGLISVYYHGTPAQDPSGFGGFYFQGGYAFNMGTGEDVIPHCFGRAWYPCFDNFIQRATYDFHITTDSTDRAACNGYLVSAVNNGNGTTTWNWQLNQTIVSYLADVAVAPYTTVSSTYYGASGDTIPILLTDVPSDTVALKEAFVHLPDAISIFESHYGPYRWNKVGYVLVPFSFPYKGGLASGSDEHASNITYPLIFLASGATTYENEMAHELSHHWFGDLVTCQTENDMWLNEGWAIYSEKIFYENLYGHAKYLSAVNANHLYALEYAHVDDWGYWAVSPVPDSLTYGSTVYFQGADAARTLRAYLGDSLFFHCLQNYMHDNAFTSQTSYTFRDYLSSCSGIDLSDFFTDWIFNPGFPHFSIDSVKSNPNGSEFNVTVYIRQRLDNAPQFFNNVPIEVTFMDNNFDSVTTTLMAGGGCTHYSVTLPFNPTFTCLNIDDKIAQAITDQFQIMKSTGSYNLSANAFMKVTVNSLSADSDLLRVEHNWVRPDAMKHPIPGLHLSDTRYWTVDGILDSAFTASAEITYNGTTATTGGYLDNTLITTSEDSLVVMYRPGTYADWSIDTNVVLNIQGSATDKRGYFTINNLKKGEYSLAIWDHSRTDTFTTRIPDSCEDVSGIAPAYVAQKDITVYPNPAQGYINIVFPNSVSAATIECYSAVGTKIYSAPVTGNQNKVTINTQNWPGGIYMICLKQNHAPAVFKKAVILH